MQGQIKFIFLDVVMNVSVIREQPPWWNKSFRYPAQVAESLPNWKLKRRLSYSRNQRLPT